MKNHLDNAKRNIKYTKINELNFENQIFQEQIDKLKYLFQHSNLQNKNLQQNINVNQKNYMRD